MPQSSTSLFPLEHLRPGQTVELQYMGPALTGAMRRRLLDLGLVPGTQIRFGLDNPLGDPRAYWVRGTLIALRRSEAAHIWVRPLAEGAASQGKAPQTESKLSAPAA